MRIAPFRVVVFDLDDTLYLERDYVRSGFLAVAAWLQGNHGWPPAESQRFFRNCWAAFQAGRRGDIFDCVLKEHRHPSPSIEALVEQYRGHEPTIELLPDARAALRCLRPSHQIWVVTDGPLNSQFNKAKALDLEANVAQVVYTDAWGRACWKPHPRAFRFIEATSGASADQCVYIADNPHKDFIAPRRLGWTTVRVRRPLGLHSGVPSPSTAAPDWEISDLWSLAPGDSSATDSMTDANKRESQAS